MINKRAFPIFVLMVTLVFGQFASVVHVVQHLQTSDTAPELPLLTVGSFANVAVDLKGGPDCADDAPGVHSHVHARTSHHDQSQHVDCSNNLLTASGLSSPEPATSIEDCASHHILASSYWCLSVPLLLVMPHSDASRGSGLQFIAWPVAATSELPPIRGSPRFS